MASESTDPHAHIDIETLVRSHQQLVARALTRSGIATRDVPDLVQEVFIVALRRLPEWQGRSKLSTWLYRVALRVASDHRRRAYQRRELLPGLDAASLEAEPELPPIERREQAMQLCAALDQLSEEHKQAFLGYELEELTVAELSKRTRVPSKTVYSRLYAARKLLRQLLLAQGWTVLAGLMSRPRRCLAWLVSPPHGLLVASCLLLSGPAPCTPLMAAAPAAASSRQVVHIVPAAPQLTAAAAAAAPPPKKRAPRKRVSSQLSAHADLKVIHVGGLERPEGPLPFGFERVEERSVPRLAVRGPRDAADALLQELAR